MSDKKSVGLTLGLQLTVFDVLKNLAKNINTADDLKVLVESVGAYASPDDPKEKDLVILELSDVFALAIKSFLDNALAHIEKDFVLNVALSMLDLSNKYEGGITVLPLGVLLEPTRAKIIQELLTLNADQIDSFKLLAHKQMKELIAEKAQFGATVQSETEQGIATIVEMTDKIRFLQDIIDNSKSVELLVVEK